MVSFVPAKRKNNVDVGLQCKLIDERLRTPSTAGLVSGWCNHFTRRCICVAMLRTL